MSEGSRAATGTVRHDDREGRLAKALRMPLIRVYGLMSRLVPCAVGRQQC